MQRIQTLLLLSVISLLKCFPDDRSEGKEDRLLKFGATENLSATPAQKWTVLSNQHNDDP